MKYSCEINNVKELCITKVDVLNELDQIKICKSYQGKQFHEINFSDSAYLSNCKLNETDFEIFPSWGNIEGIMNYDHLPQNLKNYIKYIEEYLDLPIKIVSLGPERNQTILR